MNRTVTGLIIVAVLTIIAAALLFNARTIPVIYGAPTGAGEFGDMFGLSNAIINALALAGVCGTLLLGVHTAKRNGEELKSVLEGLSRSTEAIQEQSRMQVISVLHMHLEQWRALQGPDRGRKVCARALGAAQEMYEHDPSRRPDAAIRDLYLRMDPEDVQPLVGLLLLSRAVMLHICAKPGTAEENLREYGRGPADSTEFAALMLAVVGNDSVDLARLIVESRLVRAYDQRVCGTLPLMEAIAAMSKASLERRNAEQRARA